MQHLLPLPKENANEQYALVQLFFGGKLNYVAEVVDIWDIIP